MRAAAVAGTFRSMSSSIEEAGYELSQNAISEHNERLGELRGRTATLLAAASLAASFLGGQSIRGGDLGMVGGVALIAYLVCVGACIAVLLPHRLVFWFRGSTLIETAREAQADLEEALEVATGWFENFLEDNRIELERLTRWYTIACLALGSRDRVVAAGSAGYPRMTMAAAPKTAPLPAPAPLPKKPPPGFGIPEKRGSTPDDRK